MDGMRELYSGTNRLEDEEEWRRQWVGTSWNLAGDGEGDTKVLEGERRINVSGRYEA
jgi:hypothetical protein